MVVPGSPRKRFVAKSGTWVRIPPSPPSYVPGFPSRFSNSSPETGTEFHFAFHSNRKSAGQRSESPANPQIVVWKRSTTLFAKAPRQTLTGVLYVKVCSSNGNHQSAGSRAMVSLQGVHACRECSDSDDDRTHKNLVSLGTWASPEHQNYFQVTSIPKKCMNTSRVGLFFGFGCGLRM